MLENGASFKLERWLRALGDVFGDTTGHEAKVARFRQVLRGNWRERVGGRERASGVRVRPSAPRWSSGGEVHPW